MKKIIIINNLPSPYRIPLFNEISTEFKQRDWLLKVVFLTKTYKRRKWETDEKDYKFDFCYLNGPIITKGEGFSSIALNLIPLLIHEEPDFIIVAGFSFSTLWVLLFKRMFQKPFAIWTGETSNEAGTRNFVFIRRLIRHPMITNANAFLVYGSQSKKFLYDNGVPLSKIYLAINTVDTDYYKNAVRTLAHQKKRLLSEMQLPAFNILFVGHLEKRKGLYQALKAIKHLSTVIPLSSFAFHIIGSGPEYDHLRAWVDKNELVNIHFWGFKQKEEIAKFLAISDVLIFPSLQELYGLVPIEAMACGVPVLCSKYAGCTVDLILDGVNGWIFDPNNTEDLSAKLAYLIKNKNVLKNIGINAVNTIQDHFTISKSANSFLKAVNLTSQNEA